MTFRFPIAIAFALVAGVAAAAAPPHIVLVSVDTLRADRLGAYGYDEKTSPFLDSLAEGGWRFEQALVPLPATTPSHASLLTSSLPSRHGSLGNAYGISRTVDTLAQALARKGYRTAGAVAVSHIGRKQGFERGFHSFTEPEATTQNPHGDLRRDAIAVNRDALGAVDRHVAAHRARPLFLFVHYFDAHYPYRWWDAAESNPNPYAPAEINDVAKQNRRYDEGVRHVDAQLRRLHDGVRAKLGTNVIFVVTSDHGEQLGEHGFTGGHADIYRETVRVPLIVSGARIEKATITTTVSTMDVGVSLLKLAGGRYAKPVDGRDFTPHARRAEGLLTRWLPDDDERAFLITGNPWYSRSLLLVQGDQWYIRNFDHIYRTATIATPAPPAGTATWNAAPREANSGDDSVTYRIPFSRYEPFSVTIDHVAARPGCKAELNVLVAPGVAYLREAAPFDTSIRVTIPAARRDVLTVAVKPASCAGATVYSVSRYEAPQTSTLTTTFASSLVARKLRTEDEMYNAASDPFMTKNLIPAQSAKPYADKLRAVYEAAVAASGKQAVTRTLSDEELRKLRSLGYIQ